METTLIQNICLNDVLSNIKAEAELTPYLAAENTDHNKGTTTKLKKCIVTSGTGTNGITCVPSILDTHSREEADTLILYHALSIGKHAEVVIASPYIDVSFWWSKCIQSYPVIYVSTRGRET